MLLQHNPNSIRNSDGRFPIHLAARSGHQKLVKILIEHPGIWEKDRFRRTVLHYAALSGRVPVIQLVISKCKAFIDDLDEDGNTPSMLALHQGHIEATHFLLDLHANPKITNNIGFNLLHLAASHGDLNLIKRLTSDGGCDVKQRNAFGDTALLIAADHHKAEVFNELLRLAPETLFIADFSGYGCQHAAAATGNLNLLKRLETLQLALDQHNLLGRTPMYYAAGNGHHLVVSYLNSLGCATNHADINGDTPLLRALIGGHLETALYLIERSTTEDLNRAKTLCGDTILTSSLLEDMLSLLNLYWMLELMYTLEMGLG